MTDLVQYTPYIIAGISILFWVALSVVAHFIPEEKKRALAMKAFLKDDLPRIEKKCGITDSIWFSHVRCPRDGSRCYQKDVPFFESSPGFSRNFSWFCPVCDKRMDFSDA